jgi:hypothetical protein
MKMSQVEFVAVMATIFKTCNLEPVLQDGESMKDASARLLALTQDSMVMLTLQMNKPHEVNLRWKQREIPLTHSSM